MNKRQIGTGKEELTASYLIKNGYHILERNYRCRQGEIDIIAKDGNYLVFVEVKYRKTGKWGDPAEAVDRPKQHRICRAARYYLYQHRYGEDQPCRFDVAALYGDGRISYIKGAFGAEGETWM